MRMTIGSGRLFLVARGIQGVSWIRPFSVNDSFICGPKSWNLKVKWFATFHERKSTDFTGFCGHLWSHPVQYYTQSVAKLRSQCATLSQTRHREALVGCHWTRLVADTKATKCAVESDRAQVEQLIRKLYSSMATIEILWDYIELKSGRDQWLTLCLFTRRLWWTTPGLQHFCKHQWQHEDECRFSFGFFSNESLGSFLWAQEEICLEWLSRKLSESEYSKSAIGPACRCVVTLRHKTRPNSSTHHVHTSECFHDLPQVVPLDVYADCILISRKCLRLLGMNRADWALSNLFTRISDNTASAELVVSPSV